MYLNIYIENFAESLCAKLMNLRQKSKGGKPASFFNTYILEKLQPELYFFIKSAIFSTCAV